MRYINLHFTYLLYLLRSVSVKSKFKYYGKNAENNTEK